MENLIEKKMLFIKLLKHLFFTFRMFYKDMQKKILKSIKI